MLATLSSDATPATGLGKSLRADPIAAVFRQNIQLALTDVGRKPCLVGILGTTCRPSQAYAESTRKTCEGLGFQYELRKIAQEGDISDVDRLKTVRDAIEFANNDPSVDGIMVYYPIFGIERDRQLQQLVSPLKDVEGLHPVFHNNLYNNVRFIQPSALAKSGQAASTDFLHDFKGTPSGMAKSVVPCTPLAIVKCLEYVGIYNRILSYGDRAYGKTVTIINRSDVVGRPLAALLANDGARVFSVDIDGIQEFTKRPAALPTPPPSGPSSPSLSSSALPGTAPASTARSYRSRHVINPTALTLQECLALSDAVISAVPNARYKVPTNWLKEGCICVNVAMEKNFETDVLEKAAIYIPAVGKVTIVMLLRNLLRLRSYQEIMRAEVQHTALLTPPLESDAQLA